MIFSTYMLLEEKAKNAAITSFEVAAVDVDRKKTPHKIMAINRHNSQSDRAVDSTNSTHQKALVVQSAISKNRF